MATNRVSISFTEEQIQRVLAAIVILETELAPLISIPVAERAGLFKMGDKSEVFAREVLAVLLDNPKLVSESMGLPEAVADLKALDQLRPILRRLQVLVEKGESTEMGLGADLMQAMLEGYATLKVSGKHHGLEGKRRELSARFARTSRKATEPTVA
jgi:hypothetical protein